MVYFDEIRPNFCVWFLSLMPTENPPKVEKNLFFLEKFDFRNYKFGHL